MSSFTGLTIETYEMKKRTLQFEENDVLGRYTDPPRFHGMVPIRPGSFVCPGSEIRWVTGVDDSGIGNDVNAYFLTGVSKPRNLKPQTNP